MNENCPDLLGAPRNSRESFVEIQSIISMHRRDIDSSDSVS